MGGFDFLFIEVLETTSLDVVILRKTTSEVIYMIQIITLKGIPYADHDQHGQFHFNKIASPQSLDSFKINIIDLCDTSIWRFSGSTNTNISIANDFRSLCAMISNTKKSKIVIILPQNLTYIYNTDYSPNIRQQLLKDMLPQLVQILSQIHSTLKYINLVYENTYTNISGTLIEAAFYFNGEPVMLTLSNKSKKCTTIVDPDYPHIFSTTLNLKTCQDVFNFLGNIRLISVREGVPTWVENIKMFDDLPQSDVIIENEQIIKDAQNKINIALDVLNRNNQYKSILFTSGEELVSEVLLILQELVGWNLIEFIDKKKEDFSIISSGRHFLGEIKGVNSNVKNEHISQLEVHHQTYLEANGLENSTHNVKALLIIAHQRSKPFTDREPINENQVKLAKKYGSLIVETHTLLKLLEKRKNGQISSEQAENVLFSHEGILKISDFE